jgi:hypothetical protein
MLENILKEATEKYTPMDKEYTFYFVFDDDKKYTIFAKNDGLTVEEGKKVEDANCVCKMTSELFEKVWYENYKPGMKEIFSGTLKTNNPEASQKFLKACGK